MSFGPKLLQAQFSGAQLGGGSLTFNNLRMQADISVPSADAASTLTSLVIYGMSLSDMNRLSTAGASYNTVSSTAAVMQITLSASDNGQPYATVFQGDIIPGMTYVDGSDQPNIRFLCSAVFGAANARKKIAPTSHKGAIAGETLLQQLAQQMGWRFENNNVHVMLSNPYLWGTGISQIRQCVESMNCEYLGHLGTLAIWPAGGSRSEVYTISPPKLVGYPSFSQSNIFITAYYDPAFIPCSQVRVQGSQLTAANGLWNNTGETTYELDSLVPHGRWFMKMRCMNHQATGQAPGGEQG
jgi:hypothetical protein